MIPIIGGVPMGASLPSVMCWEGQPACPWLLFLCDGSAVLAFNKPVTGDKQVKISDSFGRPGEDASIGWMSSLRGLGMPRTSAKWVSRASSWLMAEYTMLDFWSRRIRRLWPR